MFFKFGNDAFCLTLKKLGRRPASRHICSLHLPMGMQPPESRPFVGKIDSCQFFRNGIIV